MSKFWQNKRVTITGGAGFVGSHLCKHLAEAGAIVEVLDIAQPKRRIPSVTYRSLDASNLHNCIAAFEGRDIVFNLAAKVAGVEYNQNHNLNMMYENIPLQITPVVAAEEAGVAHFLQVSSVCIYPDNETSPCQDSRSVGEMKPPNLANFGYATAKRIGELAVMQSKLNYIIARPTNIYGPGDDFGPSGHVIPALIKKCLKQPLPQVNGTGKEVREFIFVSDVAKAFMHLVEFGESGVYNIGTNRRTAITIRDLLDVIQISTATKYKGFEFINAFDSGDSRRFTDSTKLEATGFKAETSLVDGINQTVEWWSAQ